MQSAIILAAGTGTIYDGAKFSLNYSYVDNNPDNSITFTTTCKGAGFVQFTASQVNTVYSSKTTTTTTTTDTRTLGPTDIQPILISLYYMNEANVPEGEGLNLIYRPYQGSTKAAQIQILPRQIAQLL